MKNQTTTSFTEADLEARLHGALKVAFPWLPGEIKHQLTFSVKVGHKEIPIGSKKKTAAQARLDILLSWHDQPLAVFELKRDGEKLTEEDKKQGLSYAKLLQPSPPLVVVTNGTETILLETHTCKVWTPATKSEQTLMDLLANATKASQDELQNAIETLMGSNSDVWMEAVRQTSIDSVNMLVGNWNDSSAPFVADFQIPRKLTEVVLDELQAGEKLILVEGQPLVGKSSVLRQLVDLTRHNDTFAMLFIDAGSGVSIFQQIAYLVSSHLGWNVTATDVRSWLQKLSQNGSAVLVLVVDGLDLTRNDVRKDLEELISGSFGNGLRIVVSIDESVVENITLNATGRQKSSIGIVGKRQRLEPLSNEEFQAASDLLFDRMISLTPGAQLAVEYRQPWILRTLVASIMENPSFGKNNLGAVLPPLLSMSLIRGTRQRFKDFPHRGKYQSIAKALLDDIFDTGTSVLFKMQLATSFIVRKTSLRRYFDGDDIKELKFNGYLRELPPIGIEEVFTVRLPELLASELALVLAERIRPTLKTDAEMIADMLSKLAIWIPLGDIVAASALVDVGSSDFDLQVIKELLDDEPRKDSMNAGMKFSIVDPDFGLAEMNILEDDKAEVIRSNGERSVIDLDDSNKTLSCGSWLVLSHFGSIPMEIETKDERHRVDATLLLEVGQSPHILIRPNGSAYFDHRLIHENTENGESIMCHRAGIVEPITAAIYHYLHNEGEQAESWIRAAIDTNSHPLIARIHIALKTIAQYGQHSERNWAREMNEELVEPAQSADLRHEHS